MKYKKYDKKEDYTYVFGAFPLIEALLHQPQHVMKVITSSRLKESEAMERIVTLCNKHAIPLETDDTMIQRVSPKENTFIMGVIKKYSTLLEPTKNHVVLYQVSDMGNIGTILRTMAGFDFFDLALIQPSCDYFDPRVIRASMGALFQVRVHYFDSIESYIKQFLHNIFAFMLDAEKSLPEATFKQPYSLVFGSEGPGLPKDFVNMCRVSNTKNHLVEKIVIPQSDKIDSLNLAVSAGIVMYQTYLLG